MPYNHNKKIVLRFLKDLGLLQAWRIYISNSRYYKETVLTQRKWYEEKYIDRIFGLSDFTRFLRTEYKIDLNSTIADIFRFYLQELKLIKPEKMYISAYYSTDVYKDVEIDKKTNNIRFRKY